MIRQQRHLDGSLVVKNKYSCMEALKIRTKLKTGRQASDPPTMAALRAEGGGRRPAVPSQCRKPGWVGPIRFW